jgi:prevent-host-death family protein
MRAYNVAEAKTHLSEILERVEAGEEILLTRRGKPVARVVPDRSSKTRRVLGFARGKGKLLPGWEDPVTEEELFGE